MNVLLIVIGKLLSMTSRLLNAGSGSTWPGHIALTINPNFIRELIAKNKNLKTILIAGTNGKTTTSKLIQTILEKNDKKVFQNTAGANLINGIASSLIFNSNLLGNIDKNYAIFEIDENTLPLILEEIDNPDFIIILNLFRDQLDRYGEVNTIANKWRHALDKLSSETKLILNADDPQIAFLGLTQGGVSVPPLRWKNNALFFGVNNEKNVTLNFQHARDSTYCPNCGDKLVYDSIYFSHLGDWSCKKCKFEHPKKIFITSPICPLQGMYNEYNTNAAVLLTQALGISKKKIVTSLKDFKPAFGRQETLSINGKKVQIFLSKNPTSFNESLKTIVNLNAKNLLVVLNDRIPDGRDISWIWDVDFDEVARFHRFISVAGDRAYDMALRLKYANLSIKVDQIYTDLKKAIRENLNNLEENETLYILPTYSAMLEVRKILTGKSIL